MSTTMNKEGWGDCGRCGTRAWKQDFKFPGSSAITITTCPECDRAKCGKCDTVDWTGILTTCPTVLPDNKGVCNNDLALPKPPGYVPFND